MSEAPSKSIETRTIVVTGGADGIGRAVVLLCAARRDNVAILDKNAEAAKKTAAEAMKQGAKCALSLACDVSSEKQIDRKSTRLNSSHGYISYAVFCLKKKKHNQAASFLPTAGPVHDAPDAYSSSHAAPRTSQTRNHLGVTQHQHARVLIA